MSSINTALQDFTQELSGYTKELYEKGNYFVFLTEKDEIIVFHMVNPKIDHIHPYLNIKETKKLVDELIYELEPAPEEYCEIEDGCRKYHARREGF
jgi:hypothetical protein